jgi:hypothetical protein
MAHIFLLQAGCFRQFLLTAETVSLYFLPPGPFCLFRLLPRLILSLLL